jgi:thiol-disulfide isomerase/thioredoxin
MFAMKRGKMGGIAVSDGRKASLYSPQLGHGGSYATADAPADLATLFGKEEFLFVSGGMSGFSLLEALVAPDPYSVLMSGVTGVSLAGTETIDGVETQHIHFKQKDLAWDMWVDTGAQPWVRRVIPDMTAMLSHYSQSKGSEATMTLVLTYKNLAANPTFADSDFQFVAPAEARQVDSFFTADAENVQSGARGMLHKPAPAITLDTLDGGKFDLSSFKGKNIVVIDFWATWCPPCRASLPILAEVTKEYEPKGVRFFAINIREEPEKVSKFLESQNLKINVALDKNADAAKAYNVMGIPQTVVIDPDGIVRDVHLGFEDNLKQSMADQLDIIMTGIKETGQKNK